MAIVAQEPTLFRSSILDNVAKEKLLYSAVSEVEVVHFWKLANIHDTIKLLPSGYSTPGDTCVQLPGGQKQMLAIARAFFHTAEPLLLNKATCVYKVNILFKKRLKVPSWLQIVYRLSRKLMYPPICETVKFTNWNLIPNY